MIVQGSHDAGGLYRFKQQAFIVRGARPERQPARVHGERDQLPRERAGRLDDPEPDDRQPGDAPAPRRAAHVGAAPVLDGGRFRLRRRARARLRARPRRGRASRTSGGSATAPTTRSSGQVKRRRDDRHRRRDHRRDDAVGARARGHGAAAARGRHASARPRPGKSAAIVRCHYSNPEVVRMAVRSRERLRQLPLHLDCDPVYTRCGWLFLVDDESARPRRPQNSAMQEEEGRRQRRGRRPAGVPAGREGPGIAYALFEPDSGFADPVATTQRLHRGLAPRRRAGARGHAGRGDRDRRRRGPRRARRRRADRVRQRRARRGRRGRSSSPARSASSCRSRSRASRTSSSTRAPSRAVPCAVSSQADRVYMRPAPEYGEGHVLVGRGFPKDYETVRSGRLRRRRSTRRSRRTCANASSARLPRLGAACGPSTAASASTT